MVAKEQFPVSFYDYILKQKKSIFVKILIRILDSSKAAKN